MSTCEYCEVELNGMPIICPKCGKHFCSKHKLPKDHECVNIDRKEEKDKGLVDHEKREKEHDKYIEEEVTIIKRRISKKSAISKFFNFLFNHSFLVLLLILIFVGYYVQTTEIYAHVNPMDLVEAMYNG